MGSAAVGGAVSGGPAAAGAKARATRIGTAGLGMLGGTFDPIHAGHIALARVAIDQLGLDRILFVPAGRPPHKRGQPITPAPDRLAMVELAIAGEPRFAVSRIEIDRPGPSYTVDTAEALIVGSENGDRPVELTVILSAESFADLPSWRDPARLLRLVRIAVAPRLGHPAPTPAWLAEQLPGFADRIDVLEGPHLDISASDIRARVAAGRPIDALVPPPVADYIEAHHLYREPPSREGPHVTESADQTTTQPSTGTPRADGLPSRAAIAPSERPPLEVARRIVELAEDKKAADIVLLDLTGPHDARRRVRHLLRGLGAPARRDRRCHRRRPPRGEDPPDRPGGDGRLPLGAARLRRRRRPHLHAAGAGVLLAREALGRGEDDPPRPVAICATEYRVGRVPSGHVGGDHPPPSIRASGRSCGRPVPRSRFVDVTPPRALPHVRTPPHHDAL